MLHRKSILLAMVAASLCSISNAENNGRLPLHTSLNNGSKKSSEPIFTPNQWTGVKVLGGLLGTAAVHIAANSIVGNGEGQCFYNGKYAWGFGQALRVSGAFLSVAPLLNEQIGDAVFRWGIRAPVVALTSVAIVHPATQILVANFPLDLGKHLSSYKSVNGHWESKCGSDCHGVCNRCFIPKSMIIVGLYKVMDPLLTRMGTAIGQSVGIIKEDDYSDE